MVILLSKDLGEEESLIMLFTSKLGNEKTQLKDLRGSI